MIQDIFISNDLARFVLPDHARIWIFQADRFFTDKEAADIQLAGDQFAAQWQAHGKELSAQFVLSDRLFAIMAIDEQVEGASGCSIDKFMRFILDSEMKFGLSLTNRMCFAFISNDEIKICRRKDIETCKAEAGLDAESLVFDNLIPNLGELRRNRLKPASQTWLAGLLK